MPVRRALLSAVVVSALSCASAQAALFTFAFGLDALQEVPSNPSPGTGFGIVNLDTDTSTIDWNISYQDLVGNVTMAHFHGPAAIGVNAGIQIGIAPPITNPLVGSTSVTATQISQILAGLWYVNIHTDFRPGGEIRGQVIPEPSSVVLMSVGVIAAAGYGWKRRKSRFKTAA